MRRLLVFTAFSGLVLAPGVHAAERSDLRQFLGPRTQSLELWNGVGRATIVRRAGVVLGSVRRGRVVVTAPAGKRPVADLSGCERVTRPSARTIVCRGRFLRFAMAADRRITTRGSGIDVTAVMRGSVTLRGRQGTYSIGGEDPRRWPRVARTFRVGG